MRATAYSVGVLLLASACLLHDAMTCWWWAGSAIGAAVIALALRVHRMCCRGICHAQALPAAHLDLPLGTAHSHVVLAAWQLRADGYCPSREAHHCGVHQVTLGQVPQEHLRSEWGTGRCRSEVAVRGHSGTLFSSSR